jgi:hypothetical protein
LKSQSALPDGNHNFGVSALCANKTDAALPYFKAALLNEYCSINSGFCQGIAIELLEIGCSEVNWHYGT